MILTLGEALVDMIEQPCGLFAPALGGSIANFSVAAALLNTPVTYLNALSEDRFGQRFAQWMKQAGVDGIDRPKSSNPTSLAIVMIDANGKAQYAFHRDQVADRSLSAFELINRMPAHASVIHTGCLALVPDDIDKTLAVIDEAKNRGLRCSVDANIRSAVDSSDQYLQGVWRALKKADYIKVSDDDAASLGIEGLAPKSIAAHIFERTSASVVAVTVGDQGAYAYTRQDAVFCAAPSNIKLIDTVGAGDCFWAAFISTLLSQNLTKEDPKKGSPIISRLAIFTCLSQAVLAATISVQRIGCQPATLDELKATACKRNETPSDLLLSTVRTS
jgi:fructokinase